MSVALDHYLRFAFHLYYCLHLDPPLGWCSLFEARLRLNVTMCNASANFVYLYRLPFHWYETSNTHSCGIVFMLYAWFCVLINQLLRLPRNSRFYSIQQQKKTTSTIFLASAAICNCQYSLNAQAVCNGKPVNFVNRFTIVFLIRFQCENRFCIYETHFFLIILG